MRQAITWTNDNPVHRRIYAALGGDDLTRWGRVAHIYFIEPVIIGSHNGLSPLRCQAIIVTSADILSIRPQGAWFSGILLEIYKFSFGKTLVRVVPLTNTIYVVSWWPIMSLQVSLGLGARECHLRVSVFKTTHRNLTSQWSCHGIWIVIQEMPPEQQSK